MESCSSSELSVRSTDSSYNNKPNLRALRLQRLKDYVQIFGLSPPNSVGLDSIVHGAEYRREREIDEQLVNTGRLMRIKKRELR